PISNHRNDGYGGSFDKRIRFPLEVFTAVREVWAPDKPLGVRVSATDWVDGGWTIEDSIAFARRLQALGCDWIDVSSGGISPAQTIRSTGPAALPVRTHQFADMFITSNGKQESVCACV